MRTSVVFLVLTCLCAVRGWDGGRRSLKQEATAQVSISVVGEGRASGRTEARSRSSSTTDAFLVSRATSLFISGDSVLENDIPEDVEAEDFCSYAISAVDAEASAFVTAEANAFASSSSEAVAQGNARVTTSGEASAAARAEEFGDAIVEGAVLADIGVNRAEAEAVVENYIDVFAEAFATASTSAEVIGEGSANSSSIAESRAAVTAVAEVAVQLLAEVDCKGSVADIDVVSTTEVLSSETTATTGSGAATTGADADSTAAGDAGGSTGVVQRD